MVSENKKVNTENYKEINNFFIKLEDFIFKD